MALKPGHVTLGESELLELVRTQPVPRHVAVIMDGNGRWATQRGLPRVAGHSEGVKSARTVVRTADTLGVGYLTLYAFSSENWSRPSEEVATLMSLLERSIHQELPELMARNIRLRVIGRAQGEPAPAEIDEDRISRALYTGDAPDPDLLIRTSGEMRISNFLLWQIAYTELWVTSVLWPDFGPHDLYSAIAEYQRRERRFG